MKLKCPLIAIVLIFSLSLMAAPPLNSPPVLDELIVEIPAVNGKTEQVLRSRLTAVPGVYFNGYCELRKMYLLRVDRSIQPNNDFLENILHNDYQYSYYIKIGCTIEQARAICEMPASTTDPEQNQQ